MDNGICVQKINDLLNCGGKITLDKSEGTGGFIARTVHIKLGNCQFKIGYMILGDREVVVQLICTCNNQYKCPNNVTWNLIPNDCLHMNI